MYDASGLSLDIQGWSGENNTAILEIFETIDNTIFEAELTFGTSLRFED
jgi:hypothetical protein